MTAEENLKRLGIVLPEPPGAVANYVAWIRTGNLGACPSIRNRHNIL